MKKQVPYFKKPQILKITGCSDHVFTDLIRERTINGKKYPPIIIPDKDYNTQGVANLYSFKSLMTIYCIVLMNELGFKGRKTIYKIFHNSLNKVTSDPFDYYYGTKENPYNAKTIELFSPGEGIKIIFDLDVIHQKLKSKIKFDL